jgi:exopolysaccharide biosynthesis predicted pyruvyltransferase EpsI
LGINAIQSFDTAVLAPFNNITYKLTVLENNEYCLFTGSNIKKYDLLKIAEEINIKGFVPLYIPMGLNDFKDFTELKKSNILSLDFSQVNLSQLIYLIKNSKFVISGRHHLNIFSLMAEKPFIPLESNTWKIAGVCELLDIQPKFNMDLSDKIDDIIIYHHTYRKNLESKIHKSKELAKLNF